MILKNIAILVIALYFFFLIVHGKTTSPKIPDHLLDCYRNGGVNVTAPNNVKLLVEIFSRIERSNNNYNIRTVSSSLLHSLRLDGVEKARNVQETENVIPYRASSFQFDKLRFLLDYLIPGDNLMDLLNDIPLNDKCSLHFLLSSTINRWERGDESRVCPLSMNGFIKNPPYAKTFMNRTSSYVGISRCPIEKGVMQTPWGDVSAGVLLSGISAALEPQNILMSDIFDAMIKNKVVEDDCPECELREFFEEQFKLDIESAENKYLSNVLAATVSGDLAEVIVRQGPYVSSKMQKFVYGSWTKWNDSILPRNLYLMQEPPYNWEMTNAEILGGIDGFIIANHIKDWLSVMANTRLSQIIEMYYSNHGMAFNREIKACNRKRNFAKLLETSDIQEQTPNMAKFLWMKTGSTHATQDEVERLTELALKDFNAYWPKLVDTLPGCEVLEDMDRMEILVVTDGTWTKYQTEQLLSKISQHFDISLHGSKIGLMHGNTGEWISYPTNSLIELYGNISNYTDKWTSRLDYPSVLTTIITTLQNSSADEDQNHRVAALPRLVLIVAPTTKFSKVELETSRAIMHSLRTNHVDVYFAYYMDDEEAFKTLSLDPRKNSDILINNVSIDVNKAVDDIRIAFVEKTIPKRLIPPPCKNYTDANLRYQYEDYVRIGKRVVYRIHPNFMMYSETVNVQFQGTDQGEMTVCLSRNDNEASSTSCKIIMGQEDASFEIARPCDRTAFCDPVYFIVQYRNATLKCSDRDCRYPDQIRYIVRHNGLRCLTGSGNVYNNVKMLIISVLLLHVYFYNSYD